MNQISCNLPILESAEIFIPILVSKKSVFDQLSDFRFPISEIGHSAHSAPLLFMSFVNLRWIEPRGHIMQYACI